MVITSLIKLLLCSFVLKALLIFLGYLVQGGVERIEVGIIQGYSLVYGDDCSDLGVA